MIVWPLYFSFRQSFVPVLVEQKSRAFVEWIAGLPQECHVGVSLDRYSLGRRSLLLHSPLYHPDTCRSICLDVLYATPPDVVWLDRHSD